MLGVLKGWEGGSDSAGRLMGLLERYSKPSGGGAAMAGLQSEAEISALRILAALRASEDIRSTFTLSQT